jgi:hypothetical protein
MNKVSEEIAETELNEWLERNHISEDKIESQIGESQLKVIKRAIKNGRLVLDEEAKLHLTLTTPIGSAASPITELIFNARVNRKMVMPHLNGVKADNGDMRLVAYMVASTGKNKAILTELMPEDQVVADAITVFFVS